MAHPLEQIKAVPPPVLFLSCLYGVLKPWIKNWPVGSGSSIFISEMRFIYMLLPVRASNLFYIELMFTWPKICFSGEFCFISCKPNFASVTLFVNLEDIFRDLDWWLRLQLSQRCVRNDNMNYILHCTFWDWFEPVTFWTGLEDIYKWTLFKLLSELLSAPKEQSFLDVMLKYTVLAVDLDTSSKNRDSNAVL